MMNNETKCNSSEAESPFSKMVFFHNKEGLVNDGSWFVPDHTCAMSDFQPVVTVWRVSLVQD